jgi:hypothetical protein
MQAPSGALVETRRFGRANVLAWTGATLLIVSIIWMNNGLSFPGFWALLPVLGSVFLIYAGPGAWFNRVVLSNRVMVGFGLISFPLYLWHWPLLSFGQIIHFDTPSLKYRVNAVLLSIALAWLTVKLIEKPLRFGAQHAKMKVIGLSLFMALLGIWGGLISQADFSSTHTFEQLSVKRKGEHAVGSSLSWYRGKDDWLFLGNAYDDGVAKVKLSIRPKAEKVAEVKQVFSLATQAAHHHGAKIALILGPDKTSIYPEFLPEVITPSPIRYSAFFLNELRTIERLTVYDPSADLLTAKNTEGLLYWRTDTHWNAKGAYLAYVGLMKHLSLPYVDLSFKQGEVRPGDLIGISKLKDFPIRPDDHWEALWTKLGDSGSKALVPLHIWVVGDSFTEGLKDYLNASFAQVHYLGHWDQKLKTLPQELEQAPKKPDLILVVRVERSF